MYGANYDYGMLRALPSFMNGILLAMLFRQFRGYRSKPLALGGILVFLGSVLVLNVFAKPDLAIILFSLAILLTAIGESAFTEVPGAAWLGRLGNTSYAIYMLHELLLILVFKPVWHQIGLTPGAFPLFALGCCAVLTMAAGLTYSLIENPARKLINRLAPRDSSRRSLEPKHVEALDLNQTRQAANAG